MTKPNREPDYVSHLGNHYWFEELVRVKVYDGAEAESLILVDGLYLGMMTSDGYEDTFIEEIQQAYQQWILESTLLNRTETKISGQDKTVV